IRIFDGSLAIGTPYRVVFTSAAGAVAEVGGTAILARDLADSVEKPQLAVALPALPLGPVAVAVFSHGSAGAPILATADDALTVLSAPIVLPNRRGAFRVAAYRAGVGRDGEVLLPFDLTGVTMPLVVRAKAVGYPLRF